MTLRDRWWMILLRRRRWLKAVLDVEALRRSAPLLDRFDDDWNAYRALPGAEPVPSDEALPCLHDRMDYTPFDAHYVYQAIWAINRIRERGAALHVDVGSLGMFVGMLTAVTEVEAVDIRPLALDVERFRSREGSLLDLPYDDASVDSISCLHVVEHVGLGRYGDRLDPEGSVKALRELARVVAPGGRLLLSVPIGRSRTQFNAHRVLAPSSILDALAPLRLVDFAAVDDDGRFVRGCAPGDYAEASYACGMFEMTRDSEAGA